jgi:hypothetical protein
MKKTITIILIIILVVLISGFFLNTYIADVSAISKITVDVEKINIQHLGLSFCELQIIIGLYNPTNRDTSNLEASFDMFITGNYIGEGILSEVSIPSESYTQKDVYLTIYYSEVASGVVDAIKSRDFTLSIEGEVHGSVLFGFLRVSDQIEASKKYL